MKGKRKPLKECDAFYFPPIGLKKKEEGTVTRRQEENNCYRSVPPDKSYGELRPANP